MAGLKVALVVLMCMAVVGAPIAQAAITCGQITNSLAPCLGYIQSGTGPAPVCCNGIWGLLAAARTTLDRQSVCNCLKNTAAKLNFNAKNADSLPGECGVNIPYKISSSTNCARIGTSWRRGRLVTLGRGTEDEYVGISY